MTADFFARLCTTQGLPAPVAEFRFHPTRRWRFDRAWPAHRVALEIDGGVWTGGRHTRGGGWHKDTEKLNTAASMGWRVLRCTPETLHDLALVALLRAALTFTPEP